METAFGWLGTDKLAVSVGALAEYTWRKTVQKFRNSMELVKSSWSLLKADRELLWLPVLSGLSGIGLLVLFMLPGTILFAPEDSSLKPVGIVLFVLGSLAISFSTIFFNAAIVHGADERMRGGDPTMKSALNGAWARRGRILPWAIVSTTVSVIIRSLEERFGFVGRIVGGLVGIAWSLVTFLVLPILVIEGIGVRDAITRSSELFRRTWGEQMIANAGIGIVALLAMLPVVAIIAVAAAIATPLITAPLILLAVLYGIALAVVMSAMSGIYQTALYHYAANGMPPAAFATANLDGAFVARRRRDR